MVAVITGTGLGVERGSGFVLGSRGQLGDSTFGRYGENVTVNAATGNLAIQRTDEILIGQGTDDIISRAYNSLGPGTDDNGDNWRLNAQRMITAVSGGSVNTAGTTVRRVDWDGSDTLYTYDALQNLYVGMQGSGAYDTLSFAGTTWTWTDGNSRTVETYDGANGGRIATSKDADGNGLTYTYDGSARLIKVTTTRNDGTSNQEHTDLTWSGNNLSQVQTYWWDTDTSTMKTLTRVRYTYDGSNRLSTVTTDLSPDDGVISDGNTVVTTYTYATGNQIASIAQTGGALLAITYDSASGRVSGYTQTLSSGITSATTLSYDTVNRITTITDQLGNVSRLTYDTNGQLVKMELPPAQSGAAAQVMTYTYNANGDVLTATDGSGNTTSYGYDAYNNLNMSVDAFGNTMTRTYGANNQLLTETHYLAPAGFNQAPTAAGDSITTWAGSSTTFDPRTNDTDPDGDALIITAAGTPSHGSAVVNSSMSITYTAAAGYSGTDSFTYVISDGAGHSVIGTVSVTVLASGNQPPTAVNDTFTLTGSSGSTTFDPRINDTDPDGDTLTIISVSAPSLGTAVINSGTSITYTRTAAGLDGFTYTISDGHGNISTASVTVRAGGLGGGGFTPTGGGGAPPPAATLPVTTRYAYDGENHLRFAVSALGEVTEYRYDTPGNLLSTIVYRDNSYSLAGLVPTDPIPVSTLESWVTGISDKSTVERADTAYDFRGNVRTVTGYTKASTAGVGLTTAPYTVITYIYDQFGSLRSRANNGLANFEAFTYDGLGRTITAHDLNNAHTTITFNDGADTSSVFTTESGLTTLSTYNDAGQLISTQQSATGITAETTLYAYDKLGNLRMVTDAALNKHYYLYDAVGRKVADIAADGAITEYRYDASDRLISTTSYATNLTSTQLASLEDGSHNPTNVALGTIRPSANHSDLWSWRIYDNANRLIETIDGQGDASIFYYDGMSNLVETLSFANLIPSATVTGYQTTPPTTLQWPATSATLDNVTRNFFDNDGRLMGSLDGSGYLTRIVYNAAGEKIETIAYQGVTSSGLRSSGSFGDLLGSITAGAGDIHNRYVYDAAGRLQYTLDNQLIPTEYVYDNAGHVVHTIQYGAAIGSGSVYSAGYVAGQITTLSLLSNAATRTTWNVYDGAGRVAYAIDATGGVVANIYDAAGRLKKQVAYADARTTTSDPSASVMDTWAATAPEVSNTGNRTTRLFYDALSRVVYTMDGEGYVTQTLYDADNRVTGQIRLAGVYTASDTTTTADMATAIGTIPSTAVQTGITYDPDGRVSDASDGVGTHTHFVYDALGRVLTKTVAYGLPTAVSTAYAYDNAGRVVSVTDGMGVQTVYSYDGLGNLLTVTDRDGYVTSYTYDTLGQVLTVTVPLDTGASATTSYLYDAFGNVIRTTDPLGNPTYNFYDALDRLVLTLDGEGYATSTNYNVFGEVTSVVHYANKVTVTIVPGMLPTIVPSASDETTTLVRDKLGRVIQSIDALGFYETYALNAFGDRLLVTNKLGGLTTNTYDRRGLLLSESLAETAYTTAGAPEATAVVNKFTYDARGNRLTMVEAYGLTEQRTTTYTYDKDDRLLTTTGDAVSIVSSIWTGVAGTFAPVTTNIYDARGNLIEQDDAAGARTLFYYDKNNRKIAQLNALGTLSTWAYDGNGNVTQQRVYGAVFTLPTLPGGTPPSTVGLTDYRQTAYAYYKNNQLKTTTVAAIAIWQNGMSGAGTTADLVIANHYDAAGNLTWQTDARGNATWFFYDKRGDKVAQVDQELYLTTYALDQDGNVTAETRYATRLGTAPTTPPPAAAPSVTGNAADRITNFTYDLMGRRLTEQRMNVDVTSVNATTGALTTATSYAKVVYTYNALGEVLRKSEAANSNADYTDYTYDAFGRQSTVTTSAFTDYAGASVGTTVANYYSGIDNLVRSVENAASGTAARVTTYAYGAGGRLSTVTDPSGFWRVYGYDITGRALLSVYSRLASSGATTIEADLYHYDALGRVDYQGKGLGTGTGYTLGDKLGFQYDAWGEVAAKGVNDLFQETFAYDNAGRLYRSTAGDGTVKLYLYDADGNQTAMITSDGAALPSGYSWSTLTVSGAVGLLTTGGAALGSVAVAGLVVTLTTYDKRGMATSTIEPGRILSAGGAATTITHARSYNAFGEVATETDARGDVTTYAYDTLGKVITTTLPAVSYTDESGTAHSGVAPVSRVYYDASGRIVATTDANGNTNARILLAGSGYGGAEAQAVKEFHPDGGIFNTGYDVFRDKIKQSVNGLTGGSEIDETFAYDKMDRVVSDTHPLRGDGTQLIDTYTYDGLGQRLTHGNNLLTVKETTDYDRQGRVTKSVDFDGYATTYGYAWSTSGVLAGVGGWIKTTGQLGLTGTLLRSESESDDYFGRTVAKTDFSSIGYTFTYDSAGRLIRLVNSGAAHGEQTVYAYFNTGNLASVTQGYLIGSYEESLEGTFHSESGDLTASSFAYDADGNRVHEGYTRTKFTSHYTGVELGWVADTGGYGVTSFENATVTWDADNRMTSLSDTGAFGTTPVSISWKYDLAGNIRNMHSVSSSVSATGAVTASNVTEDYWYKYDGLNRFTVTMGTLSGGVISAGAAGSAITYNKDNSRATMTDASSSESYAYTADGYVAQVTIGGSAIRAKYVYDAMGRVTAYHEYNASGYSSSVDNTVYSRVAAYDGKGQVLSDTVATLRGTTWTTLASAYVYDAQIFNTTTHVYESVYQGGSAAEVDTTTTVTGAAATRQQTMNYYSWRDSAVLGSTTYQANVDAPVPVNTSTYTYDNEGRLEKVYIHDGRPRTVTIVADDSGQVMTRDEAQDSFAANNPHEMRYYFNGVQVGDTSNNGTADTDYAASIAAHVAAVGAGAFRGGGSAALPYANFDQSYSPLNGNSIQSAASSYTVQGGDTLQSIAQMVWGDASLWYLIAGANGLSANGDLAAGMSLVIPNKVTNVHNNASTFKVYDPNTAVGDTAPTAPKPAKHSGCGVMGQILLAVIAVAVTIVTAGAAAPLIASGLAGLGVGTMTATVLGGLAGLAVGGAVGSIVSQGVGVAAGIQDAFNWNAVGMSAIGAMVGGARSGAGFLETVVESMAASALTQGIGVALGLQKKFDWTAVAAAGVGSAAGYGVGSLTNGTSFSSNATVNAGAHMLVTGMARDLANAGTRTLINGSDFGDNIIAALPDTIGETVGSMFGSSLSTEGDNATDLQSAGKIGTDLPERQASKLMAHVPDFVLNPGDLRSYIPTLNLGGSDGVSWSDSMRQIISSTYGPGQANDAVFYPNQPPLLIDIKGSAARNSPTQALTWSDITHRAGPGQDGTATEGAAAIQDAYSSGDGGEYWVDPKTMGMDHAIHVDAQIQESIDNKGYMSGIVDDAIMNGLDGGALSANFSTDDWYQDTGLMAFDDGVTTTDGRSVGRFGGRVNGTLTLNVDGTYTATGTIVLRKPNTYSFDLDEKTRAKNVIVIMDGLIPNPHNYFLPDFVGKPVYLDFNRKLTFTVTGHWK